ncbi:MAG: hydroxyacid-oxoacid transhydrogenase [Pseudonocardiaceae bacterium]
MIMHTEPPARIASDPELLTETIFTWQAPPLKLGLGATAEIGADLRRLGVHSVLVITDPVVARLGLPDRVARLIETVGIDATVVARVRVEPSDHSCEELARELSGTAADGFVAVGGGSTIDTAKVLNLLLTYPQVRLREYLNKPIGDAHPVPGPLRPLVAVPTTAGSGSECTAMIALDIVSERTKTGIADRRITPSLALVDPLNTVTMPPAVTAASGYDVLTHACESYTARPFDRRPRCLSPDARPIYVGANPISDVWAEQALALCGRYFVRAVVNPYDLEAREGMSRAATFVGVGFGNAGTHVPHACAYPLASQVTGYRPRDYGIDRPFLPHGEAVVATAAAAFEFTYPTAPERHLRAAELLGADVRGATPGNGHDMLPQVITSLIDATGGPRGIGAFGYDAKDVRGLVEGAMKQQRLLSCCPRDVCDSDLARILHRSL